MIKNPIFQFSVSPDEGFIITSERKSICRINIDTAESRIVRYPLQRIVPAVEQNPAEPVLLFSDGISIFMSDLDGGNLKRASMLSARKKMEQYQFF